MSTPPHPRGSEVMHGQRHLNLDEHLSLRKASFCLIFVHTYNTYIHTSKQQQKNHGREEGFAERTTHTMDTIAMERSRASFPVREMTYYLDGSPEMTKLKVGI